MAFLPTIPDDFAFESIRCMSELLIKVCRTSNPAESDTYHGSITSGIAKIMKISDRQVRKYASICGELTEDEQRELKNSEISINDADKIAARRTAKQDMEPVPPKATNGENAEPVPPKTADNEKAELVPPKTASGENMEPVPPKTASYEKTELVLPKAASYEKMELVPPKTVNCGNVEPVPNQQIVERLYNDTTQNVLKLLELLRDQNDTQAYDDLSKLYGRLMNHMRKLGFIADMLK